MQTITDPAALSAWADARRREGRRIGFVPTMGFLHDGHCSLMDRVRPVCDELVVSIYVNPLQFGPNEDLDVYPRDPEGDSRKCEDHGCDVLFMPPDLYPDGFATAVEVHGLTDVLCGAKRPGHFEGVTTVVARLFGLTRCDVACFGEKDFQQLAVIRQMVRDLAMPVEVLGGTLIRDTDGLALSSRNKFLSVEQRSRALSLHRALFAMQAAVTAGERDVAALLTLGRDVLDSDRIDYFEIRDASSLQVLETIDDPAQARGFGAAFYGRTRLIDNVGMQA